MTTKASGDTPRRLAAIAVFAAPLLTAIAPRLTQAFLPLIGLVIATAAWRAHDWTARDWKALAAPNAALVGCLVLCGYVLLNASWAWNPGAGFAKAALLLGATLFVFAAGRAVTQLTEQQLQAFGPAFAAGAMLGLAYLVIETLTGGGLTRFVFNAVPALQPDDVKRITVLDGVVTEINLSMLNLAITVIMLNMWPVLLALAGFASRRRFLLVAAVFVATATAVFASKHSSSQVALVASTLVFAAAWQWSRLVLRALAVLWCLAFVLVLPASFLAHDAKLHEHPSVPPSHKARIILWDYTAERTLQHLWLGVGVNTTREMSAARPRTKDAEDRTHTAPPKANQFPRTTGHHSHSLFLQTWFELGAVGAVLLAIAGALVILRAGNLPRTVQPYAAAAVTTFAAIAAFAWGMWQTWWICAVGLMAIYLFLSAELRAPPRPPSPRSDAEAPQPRS